MPRTDTLRQVLRALTGYKINTLRIRTMTKIIGRSAVVAALVAITTCQTMITDPLKAVSAVHTGSTRDQLTISNQQQNLDSQTWSSTCNSKVYLCARLP